MEEIENLREIMDEFTDIEFDVEILITVLHMFESYCELEKKDDEMAIVIVLGKQLALLHDDIKATITKLDKYILSNRRM